MAREILCLSAGERREFNSLFEYFVSFYGDLLWACLISLERRLIARFEFFKFPDWRTWEKKLPKKDRHEIYFLSFITQNIPNVEAFESSIKVIFVNFVNAPQFPSCCLAVLSSLWWFWTFRIHSAACHLRPYWRHSESLDEQVLRGPTIVCIFLPSFQWDIWIYYEHFIFRTVMHSEPKRQKRKKRTIIVETIGNVLMKLHTADAKAIHA